jgi:hypothetical protein
MYIKLTPVKVASGSYSQAMMLALRNFLNGSYTSVSDLSATYFDTANCEVSGTAPTAGTYHTFTSSISTSQGSYFTFYKKHHHQDTGYTPSVFCTVCWGYGCGVRMSDSNEANMIPYNTAPGLSNYAAYPLSPTYGFMRSGDSDYDAGGTNFIDEWHIIITDEAFVLHQLGGEGGNQSAGRKGAMTHIVNDLEFVDGIDTEAYERDNAYCPTVYMTQYTAAAIDYDFGDMYTIRTQHTSGSQSFYVGRSNFLASNGTFQTAVNNQSNESNYFGNNGNAQTYNQRNQTPFSTVQDVPSIHPNMSINHTYPNNALTGASPKLMTPVQYFPNCGMLSVSSNTSHVENYDSRHGTMKGFYRTSDNLATSGTGIAVGSDTYRIFRIHKTGHQTHHSADYTACYAFKQ